METIVLKFGGTSVGSTDRITAVANLIKSATEEASPVVVVSAMSGETNRLIDLAKSFGSEPNKREFDALVSTGEMVSASLVAIALNQLGLKAKSLSAAQFGMKTTSNFSRAKILDLDKNIIFKKCDFFNADDLKNLLDYLDHNFSSLFGLVNNVAYPGIGIFDESLNEKKIKCSIDVNINTPLLLSKFFISKVNKSNGGVIINATIGGGKAPNAGSLPTTVTRAAGINLTKSLANQYAKDQIRVNTICIGLIKSAQWDRRAETGKVDELYQEMSKKVPMGKVGEEIDYANLVAFLSSKRSAYITGTAINLDGGLCPVV